MALITKTATATTLGPGITLVDLYHTGIAAPNLLVTGITAAQLLAGYQFVDEDFHTTYYLLAQDGCSGTTAVYVQVPTPTPTVPTPTVPTPTPTSPVVCRNYYLYAGGSGDRTTFTFTCCNGSNQSIQIEDYASFEICAQVGTVSKVFGNGNWTVGGPCNIPCGDFA